MGEFVYDVGSLGSEEIAKLCGGTAHVRSPVANPFSYSLMLTIILSNEVFARKGEQNEIGQLEHNKPRRLHELNMSHL